MTDDDDYDDDYGRDNLGLCLTERKLLLNVECLVICSAMLVSLVVQSEMIDVQGPSDSDRVPLCLNLADTC